MVTTALAPVQKTLFTSILPRANVLAQVCEELVIPRLMEEDVVQVKPMKLLS